MTAENRSDSIDPSVRCSKQTQHTDDGRTTYNLDLAGATRKHKKNQNESRISDTQVAAQLLG